MAGDLPLMSRYALVAAGGLVGSVARYWLAGYVQGLSDTVFPYGTLVVNVLGSFVLGVVAALSMERGLLSPNLRLLLGVGFCGGFTTMSTFSYESMALLRDGSVAAAMLNIGGSVLACCSGVWLGGAVGRLV